MNIWITTTGCYSDYREDAAYSTEDAAKARVEWLKSRGGYDNEYADYIKMCVDETPAIEEVWWRVTVDAGGNVTKCSGDVFIVSEVRPVVQRGNDVEITIRADTSDRAIKVAKELWRLHEAAKLL